MAKINFVSFENRPQEQIGLRLLAISLEKQAPTALIHIVINTADGNDISWLAARPNVRIVNDVSVPKKSWDIKPFLLLEFLDRGFDRITWIDADILAARPIDTFFRDLDDATLVVTMEPRIHQPQGLRNRAIGLNLPPRSDEQPRSANSCIVSVTEKHRQLLLDWDDLLERDDYKASKEKSYQQKPFYLRSDQELLSGLLGSAKYADLDVRFLNDSTEIAQCSTNKPWSYSFFARVKSAFSGGIYFVHSPSINVWDKKHIASNTFVYSRGLHPVRMAAQRYIQDLPAKDAVRLGTTSPVVDAISRLVRHDPSLAGLPLVALRPVTVVVKRVRYLWVGIYRRIRRSISRA